MYPEELVLPMKKQLTDQGFGELITIKDVEDMIANDGTTLVVVNSVCGCAAANARPGALTSLYNEKKPDHLTTVFTEVRLKNFIEMRGADGGPWASICALPAFWVGLMYSSSSLDAALDLTKDWTELDRDKLLKDISKSGLEAEIRGVSVQEVCRMTLEISKKGLRDRATPNSSGGRIDETHFLDPLFEIVENRKTLSDTLLENYWGRWNQDLARIYLENSY